MYVTTKFMVYGFKYYYNSKLLLEVYALQWVIIADLDSLLTQILI